MYCIRPCIRFFIEMCLDLRREMIDKMELGVWIPRRVMRAMLDERLYNHRPPKCKLMLFRSHTWLNNREKTFQNVVTLDIGSGSTLSCFLHVLIVDKERILIRDIIPRFHQNKRQVMKKNTPVDLQIPQIVQNQPRRHLQEDNRKQEEKLFDNLQLGLSVRRELILPFIP